MAYRSCLRFLRNSLSKSIGYCWPIDRTKINRCARCQLDQKTVADTPRIGLLYLTASDSRAPNGICECTGECGIDHQKEIDDEFGIDDDMDIIRVIPQRCIAQHGTKHYITGGLVCLTVAHLPGREIEQCGDSDLKAMCQRCHNRMDSPMRRAGIKSRARQKMAVSDLLDRENHD